MTLTLFILGLLIILFIARYNESNKLFWQLLVAFVLCFAATKIVYNTFFAEKEQSELSLNQAYPTQGLIATLDTNKCLFTNGSCLATVVETQNLVSQDYTPEFVERTNTLSDVAGVTQRINIHVLPNPPNSTILYDTS